MYRKRVVVAAAALREMCLMHVSFCVSSRGGGETGIMHVYSDLSTHFSSLISDIPFKYPLTDTERGEREGRTEDGGPTVLISACYRLPTEEGVLRESLLRRLR